MLIRLKYLLNSYSDEKLDEMQLWVNSSDEISNILVDEWSIDLITEDATIEVNEATTKEGK